MSSVVIHHERREYLERAPVSYVEARFDDLCGGFWSETVLDEPLHQCVGHALRVAIRILPPELAVDDFL